MAVKEFNDNTSPIVFRNNFVFIIDGQKVPVSNEFYVSQIRNMNEKDAVEKLQVYDCNGRVIKQNSVVRFNKYASGNKYFIYYKLVDKQTDRRRYYFYCDYP